MGNCYIFNPANGIVEVRLNGKFLDYIGPATPDGDYSPQSISVPISRHDDGNGSLAIADPNSLSIFYPDDPLRQFGPYVAKLCLKGRNVSVDDDVVIFAGRPTANGAPSVVTMTTRGFTIDTKCQPSMPETKAPHADTFATIPGRNGPN